MKQLSIILTLIFFTLMVNAQQTEDEVYIGKGKTFGNYKGSGIIIPDVGKNTKPINGQVSVTGIVIGGGLVSRMDTLREGRGNFYSFDLKKDDGTIVTVGTWDYGFTVPNEIIGKKIVVEGKDAGNVSGGRKRRDAEKDPQQDIHVAATGIKIID